MLSTVFTSETSSQSLRRDNDGMTVLTDSSRNPHIFIAPQKGAILIVAATFHFWYKLMWQWGHKHKLTEAILFHSFIHFVLGVVSPKLKNASIKPIMQERLCNNCQSCCHNCARTEIAASWRNKASE